MTPELHDPCSGNDWELFGAARQIFEELVDTPIERRRDELAGLCGSNPQLRAEVEALLESEEASREFMATPVLEQLLRAEARKLAPGHRVGAYEILSEIGTGGMATVYLARRADGVYDKQVAVKVIDRAACSGDLVSRFEAEVRNLSRLDHPNIVRLMDGGTTSDGLMYMVMEHVNGLRLDEYLREQVPGVRERLRLFQRILEAVSYAHRNLVVHHDLKPSNILIDRDGSPKLLDFGVSRLLDDQTAERLTAVGRITLRYASPEQLRSSMGGSSGPAASTASDVYSLGVVLYEMLTGEWPYRYRGALPYLIARAILEDEPIRPEMATDLQAIVFTTLQKQPENRYASADYLRDDIDRYLAGLPVRAHRGGSAYRAGKFLRRHRAGVVLALLAITAVLAGSVSSWIYAQRARRALIQAVWLSQHRLLSGSPLVQPATLIELQNHVAMLRIVSKENPADESIQQQLVDSLSFLGGFQAHPAELNIGDTAGALATYSEAVRIEERLYLARPTDGKRATAYSAQLCSLGTILIEMERYSDASRVFQTAVAATVPIDGDSDPALRRVAYADAIANVSRVSLHERNEAECLRLRARSVAIRREYWSQRSERWNYFAEVGGALATYGWALRDFGHLQEALSAYTESNLLADEGLRLNRNTKRVVSLKARNGEQLARIFLALQKLEMARKSASDSIAQYRQLLVAEPKSAADRRGLAISLSILAKIDHAMGKPFSKEIREALALSAQCVADDPANVKVKGEESEIREIAGMPR